MDYYTWLYKREKVAMDAEPSEPPHDREFEDKHPRTKKGQEGGGRFTTSNKTISEQDIANASPRANSGGKDGAEEEESYPSYSEVYDVYNAEGVSNRLMEMVERLHEGIIKGKVKSKRLPASVFRYPEMRMIPRWLVYAYLVASGALNQHPNHDWKKEVILKDFAHRAGVYDDDDLDKKYTEEYGEPFAHGTEAQVYDMGDGYVMKTSDLHISQGLMQKLERLMLSPHFFPDTACIPVGLGTGSEVGDREGELVFALKQKKIPLREGYTDDEYVERYMRDKGWDLCNYQYYAWTNKDRTLASLDCHGENICFTKTGEMACVDPCVLPNIFPVLDGKYDIRNPPKKFEL